MDAVHASLVGQKRRFGHAPTTSGLPPTSRHFGVRRHVSKVPNGHRRSITNEEAVTAASRSLIVPAQLERRIRLKVPSSKLNRWTIYSCLEIEAGPYTSCRLETLP